MPDTNAPRGGSRADGPMLGTADTQPGPMEQQQMHYAVPCGDAYHLPFNDGDSGRLIARELAALAAELVAALEPIADTKTRTESLAIPMLTDEMILAARAALTKAGAR